MLRDQLVHKDHRVQHLLGRKGHRAPLEDRVHKDHRARKEQLEDRVSKVLQEPRELREALDQLVRKGLRGVLALRVLLVRKLQQ